MKQISLVMMILFGLAACEKAPPTAPPAPQVTPDEPALLFEGQSLKQASLDVVYANQDDLIKNGTNVDMNADIAKLQKVLNAWPEAQRNDSQACYIQLNNELTRVLNIVDGKPAQRYENQPDFRFMCSESIHYRYDQARSSAFWHKL